MNKDRILQLADIIEQSASFDMNYFFVPFVDTENDCGTPACIAGHAIHHFQGVNNTVLPFTRHAAFLLDLDREHAAILFGTHDYVDLDMDLITPAVAASHLRNIAAGGSYEWDPKFVVRDERCDE